MRFSIVFLGLLALAAAIPAVPKQQAADQDYLKKQQDVIYLLENIAGELPYAPYYEIGYKYEFDYQSFENPSVVKYYYGLFMSGNVQPKGTPYSYSVSQLRKEVALLTQIFLGAKDYQTFLYAAAWARVHVNQDQFVTAFSNAVLQRSDMAGVILPAPYEVYPQYFFDTRIIQKVQDYVSKYGLDYYKGMGDKQGYYHVYVNYTSYLPYEENQISYFTEDIGLSAYYSYVQLASYMMPYSQYAEKYGAGINHGSDEAYKKIGHGAYYYYIHQQLMARYNLERLSQGLGPIKELDYYYEHLETPYKPNFRYLNGVNFPGRDEHTYVTPRHHYYELVKVVRALEKRILDAIHTGYIITPAGSFLSLYQPQGYNILGELIEGTGRSVNPRYYGSFQYVARQLLGNAPYFKDIYDYTPSALELGQTAVRDPMFYQLYSKILEFFHYYQEALPAYQYNDVVVPGVYIEKVEMSPLITYFSDYEVSLDNAYAQPAGQEYEKQPYPKIKAHMKRLDHKEYEYTMYVQSKKVVPGAVVRVYVGPKYNYDGQPIDYSEHRHYFYEIDQFVYDLIEGQNVIVRNSHQATGQSYDYPSIYQLKERIQQGFHSQNPYYINYPEQLYGFPARLSLPKGSKSGFPLQFFFIITAGLQHQQEYYGPVLEQEWQTYQPQHYQIVGEEEYSQFASHPVDKVSEYKYYEVIPEYEGQIVVEGNFHYGYLYKKYPGSYYYPYYNKYGHYYPYHNKYSYNYPEGSYYPSYSNEKYASQYAGMYGPEYYQKYAGKYGPEYYEKYGKHYEGKYGPEYYEKYGKHYEGKYGPEYYEKYGKQYEGKYAPEYYEKYGKQYEGKYGPEYYEKYGKQYEGKYAPEYYEKYGKQYEGKYAPEYYEKYGKQYEGKFGPEYYEKYGKQYNMKYSEQYKQEYPGYKSFMPSYMYAKAGDNGKYETVYKQGSYEGYYGSGSYPGSHSFYGTYPYGTYKGYEGHDEYLHNYYRTKHIGDVIGGAVSLDNKPLGYPFDRPLAYSAFYAKNIFVKDVYIYHHDDYYNSEYHY